MASLVTKQKGNQLYYYVVASARVDGKPRIVHQAYLGTADKVAALLNERTSPVPLSATSGYQVRQQAALPRVVEFRQSRDQIEHELLALVDACAVAAGKYGRIRTGRICSFDWPAHWPVV